MSRKTEKLNFKGELECNQSSPGMKVKVQGLLEEYKKGKEKIKFFDANCWLGNPLSGSLAKIPQTAGELLKIMDYGGIEKAVVCSSLALTYGAGYGNTRLLEAISRNKRLYGAAVLLPEHTGELGKLSEYISWLVNHNVVMVKLFPKTHNFVLSEYGSGSLLRLLQKRRMPLSLWHTQTSWNDIARICGDYPQLPVIVEGGEKKLLYDNRIFYPLLKKHKNLFMETHALTNYLGLDDMVKKFGPERFLFGTFMPKNDPEAALMPVVCGNFSLEGKQMIAGNNLLSLIKNIKK